MNVIQAPADAVLMQTRSRYRESRLLARRLTRLPGEAPRDFLHKRQRLLNHFRMFNRSVSELCQWLMAHRPPEMRPPQWTHLGDATVAEAWRFLLEPAHVLGVDTVDEKQSDGYRLRLFDHLFLDGPRPQGIPEAVLQSAAVLRDARRTQSFAALLDRLKALSAPQRMMVLKAGAEYLVARYVRTMENYQRNRAQWQQEKDEWEAAHPELTEAVREEFNGLYRTLEVGENKLRRRMPRICAYDLLKQGLDNCEYAGEKVKGKRHGPLCKKYAEFLDTLPGKKYFPANVQSYLELWQQVRGEQPLWSVQEQRERVRERFADKHPQAGSFQRDWQTYLKALGLREDTILKQYGCTLPHCTDWEAGCRWNPHTELCRQFRARMEALDPAMQPLEPLSRQWRERFLAPPRPPQFRYPGMDTLPLPKLFGAGHFAVDFTPADSRIRLKVDDAAGEWIEFGFVPWPRRYDVQPHQTEITSAHIHFRGLRPIVGFRFATPHIAGRFAVTQDELDRLRSQDFPRRSNDAAFLAAARQRLVESFEGPPDQIRVLAVDLGTTNAAVAIFEGQAYREAHLLKVVKLRKLFEEHPAPKQSKEPRGLNEHHVGRHLKRVSEKVVQIADYRQGKAAPKVPVVRRLRPRPLNAPPPPPPPPPAEPEPVTLGDHDLRSLTGHIRGMIRDWVRLNAQQIIAAAEQHQVDLIVFESLRGFRLPGYAELDKDKKRRLAYWSFGQIRRKVTEKAVERGLRVVTVPYEKSSQLCGVCGREQADKEAWRKNKGKKQFVCENEGCASHMHSDHNAARVLGAVFWGAITLPEHTENG